MHTLTCAWLKQIGTVLADSAKGIATDHLGNVFICGFTFGAMEEQIHQGSRDIFLAKYDHEGNQLWLQQIGTSRSEQARAVSTDHLGNVFVSGSTNGPLEVGENQGSYDAFLAKYDTDGNQLWLKQVGTSGRDIAYGMATDHLGNAFITGSTRIEIKPGSPIGSPRDFFFLAKYDANGSRVWIKQTETAKNSVANAIATDHHGNIVISGSIGITGLKNSGDVFLAKYDSRGTQLWHRQVSTTLTDRAKGVATDYAGNIYFSGYTDGTLVGGQHKGLSDAFLAKYTAQGNRLWVKQIGTTNSDSASAIATDPLGNVFISGTTQGDLEAGQSQGSNDAFLAKYDTEGNQLWLKQLGTSQSDRALAITTDSFGSVLISGATDGGLEARHTRDTAMLSSQNIKT